MTLREAFLYNTQFSLFVSAAVIIFLIFLFVRAKQKGKTVHGTDLNIERTAKVDTGAITAVISAAVHEFRKKNPEGSSALAAVIWAAICEYHKNKSLSTVCK